MKKYLLLILSIGILIPITTFALTVPGDGTVNHKGCILWREGMPKELTMGGYCNMWDAVNLRFYELELAVIKMQNNQSAITQTPVTAPAPVYITTPDQTLATRITQLELKITALEKRITLQDNAISSLKKTVASMQKLLPVSKKK